MENVITDPVAQFINDYRLSGIVEDICTNIKEEFNKRALPYEVLFELFDFDGTVKLCIMFPATSLGVDALVDLESELFNLHVASHSHCGRIVFSLRE